MSNVQDQIRAEVEQMSDSQIEQALIELIQKQRARREKYNTPEAKARRKAWYEKNKNTPEWKAARKAQAEARKAKFDVLLQLASDRGIDVKALGF